MFSHAGIIASKRCNNLKIYSNVVYDGGEVGIFLHRSGNDCEIYGESILPSAFVGYISTCRRVTCPTLLFSSFMLQIQRCYVPK